MEIDCRHRKESCTNRTWPAKGISCPKLPKSCRVTFSLRTSVPVRGLIAMRVIALTRHSLKASPTNLFHPKTNRILGG